MWLRCLYCELWMDKLSSEQRLCFALIKSTKYTEVLVSQSLKKKLLKFLFVVSRWLLQIKKLFSSILVCIREYWSRFLTYFFIRLVYWFFFDWADILYVYVTFCVFCIGYLVIYKNLSDLELADWEYGGLKFKCQWCPRHGFTHILPHGNSHIFYFALNYCGTKAQWFR
jgi:hypothetical protein